MVANRFAGTATTTTSISIQWLSFQVHLAKMAIKPVSICVCVGVGYQMVMAKKSTCDTAVVTRLVQSHVAGARLSSDVTAELSYVLPQENKASFSQLFTDLDKNGDALGIISYGASVTTMDEVFIRLLRCSSKCSDHIFNSQNFRTDL